MKFLFAPPKVGLIRRRYLFNKAYIVDNEKDLADLVVIREVLDDSPDEIISQTEEFGMSKIENILEAVKIIENVDEFKNTILITSKNYKKFLDELRERNLKRQEIKEIV